MLKRLKQQQGIILAIIIALAAIVAAGYFSAVKRSEPKYRNKVEQMLFEEGDKSPKYVITLPEKKSPQELKRERERIASTLEPQEPKEHMTAQQRVLSNMPLLTKLEPIENAKPLKNIEPEEELVEQAGAFMLPKTSELRKPWSEYGYKAKVLPNFYRVAVVFKNFGIDRVGAEAIMKGMPPEVSFSFSPYALDIANQIKTARTAGHETYMDLLLPSDDYLSADTGPLSMDITSSPEELVQRLKQSISVNAPLGGMVVTSGAIGVDSMGHLEKVIGEVAQRGLLLLNASGEETIDLIKPSGLARNTADIVIDESFRPEDIRDKLAAAERFARNKGTVILVAEPKPIVVLEIRKWLNSFSPQLSYSEMIAQNITEPKKPFALVPLSNTVTE